ncbi:MAG: ribosome-associated translation inhibitor RaiA [Verrucomicrobiae bacterium]|nr:ribosome-associated translation inhibitor RaiA [Verrucomicrobiae bacterium]
MQIHISPRNIRLTAAIHGYIATRISNLEEHTHEIIGAHVALGHAESRGMRHRFLVKVHLALPGPDIHAETRDYDLYAAIDAVTEKLSTELRRRKGRSLSRNRRGARKLKKEHGSGR